MHEARDEIEHVENDIEHIDVPMTSHLSLLDLVLRIAHQSRKHYLAAFAGNITYNAFLAIFPFLLFLLSLLKLAHATSLITRLVNTASAALPTTAAHVIRHQILPLVISLLPNALFLSILLALGSLWAVSAVFRAVTKALDVTYGVTTTRPAWKRFALAIILSLSTALLLLAALALIIVGSKLAKALGVGSFGVLWSIAQWLVVLAVAVLTFALLYYYAPSVKPRLPFVSLGALVAGIAWLGFSVGFSLVLNHFGRYLINPLYGWFTGLIVLLLYMYWSSVILLVGAEINQIIEHGVVRGRRQQ